MRAYDPTAGGFIARDPLGRAPLFFNDNPSVYAGANPLSNVDSSGQFRASGHGAGLRNRLNTLQERASRRIMCLIIATETRASHVEPSRS